MFNKIQQSQFSVEIEFFEKFQTKKFEKSDTQKDEVVKI